MAAAALPSPTAARNPNVTDSKDFLFGIDWNRRAGGAPLTVNPMSPDRAAVMRSIAMPSQTSVEPRNGTKVFYQTNDGVFVPRSEHEARKRQEELRRDRVAQQRSMLRNLLGGTSWLIEDDPKRYEAIVRLVVGKGFHLSRLLAVFCAGVSFLQLLLFFYIGNTASSAFATDLTFETPLLVPASNATSELQAFVSPYNGGNCTLSLSPCLVLFAYAAVYRPLGYFFLVSCLLGLLLCLFPMVYAASLTAPHRAANKKALLLEKIASDASTESRTRQAAMQALADLHRPESNVCGLARYLLNPTFVAFLGAYVGTLIAMSVEFDRPLSSELVSISESLFSRLEAAIVIRAAFFFFAVVVSAVAAPTEDVL